MIDKYKILTETLRARENYNEWSETSADEKDKERYKIQAEEQEYLARLIMKDMAK